MQSFAALDYAEQVERMTRAARLALGAYDLAEADLQFLAYVNNAVFKITAPNGKAYVLRLYRPGHKRAQWIRSELTWLSAIRQQTDLQVPNPVMATNDDALVAIPVEGLDAQINAALFGWIEGAFFQNENISIEQVRKAGEFLARLHEFAATFQPLPSFMRPRLDAEGLFGENSPYNPGEGARIFTPDQQQVFTAVEARVRAVIEEIGEKSEAFGLIHADFIAKNWLFNERGACAIDFDDCSWGYYLYDLAPALLQFKYEPRYRAMREAFLAGYTSIRRLASEAEAHLETFIAARHLASCRWLAGNLHNPRIRERAADLIAQRTEELQRFLETGSLDEGGKKEFF